MFHLHHILQQVQRGELQPLEVQDGDSVGLHGPLGECQKVKGGSTIQCEPQSHQGVPTTRKESHVHHCHQLGG